MRKNVLMICIASLVILLGINVIWGGKTQTNDAEAENIGNTERELSDTTDQTNREWKYDYLDGQDLVNCREHIENCIAYANTMLNPSESYSGEETPELIAFSKQEDDRAIAIFVDQGGLDASGTTYTIVLRTEDGGKTWEINSENLLLERGTCELYTVGEYVVLKCYNYKALSGTFVVGDNYGENFDYYYNEKSFKTMFAQGVYWSAEDFYFQDILYGEVEEVDLETKTLKIRWYIKNDIESENETELYTGYYDISRLDLIRIGEINETNIDTLCAELCVNSALGDGHPNEYIFPDSQFRYLYKGELENIHKYCIKHKIDPNEVFSRAINEIYARKGFDFGGHGFYDQYFTKRSWYHKIDGKVITEEELNKFEKYNIDLLVSFVE